MGRPDRIVERGVELIRRHDPQDQRHPPVVEQAELRAMAVEGADAIGGDVDAVVDAWDEVAFHEELGDPERVDDIHGAEDEVNGLALGQHQCRLLAGRARTGHRLALRGIFELPSPLEAGDVHREVGRVRLSVRFHLRGDRQTEQHADEDDRCDRVDRFPADVARLLARDVVAATPEADADVDDESQHESAHREAGDDEDAPQCEGVLTLRRGRIWLCEASIRAGPEHQDRSRENDLPTGVATGWASGAALHWRVLRRSRSVGATGRPSRADNSLHSRYAMRPAMTGTTMTNT